MLNRDSAAAVVIPMGFNKGNTLGQVAVEKPANLQWYVDSCGGPDNLLRAAAKFLIGMASGQVSVRSTSKTRSKGCFAKKF